jgi:hypothetical protein
MGVMIATGPSLTQSQIDYVKFFHDAGLVAVMGCNDAYRICPYLDVLYGCDPQWWDHNKEALKHPCKEKWTQDDGARINYGLKLVNGSDGEGISYAPNHIHYGANSGFQLLNLAWHFGIRYFLLLGYNLDVPAGTKQHFFGPHPQGLNTINCYPAFTGAYEKIQPEIARNITNCTFPTALKCFKQETLDKALPTALLAPDAAIEASKIVHAPPKYDEIKQPVFLGKRLA